MVKKPEPRIVQSAGLMFGAQAGTPLAERMETAMREAIAKAMADGIFDPIEQRDLMNAAKDEVKAAYAKEEEERIAAAKAAEGE